MDKKITKFENILRELESKEMYDDSRHLIQVYPSASTVVVYRKSDLQMVAFSSMKSDYASSIAEFVEDYF